MFEPKSFEKLSTKKLQLECVGALKPTGEVFRVFFLCVLSTFDNKDNALRLCRWKIKFLFSVKFLYHGKLLRAYIFLSLFNFRFNVQFYKARMLLFASSMNN